MTDRRERESLEWCAKQHRLELDVMQLDELLVFVKARLSEVQRLWDLPLGEVEMPLGFTGGEEDRG